MIDRLRGRLLGGGKDFVVVECAGVGFRVHVSTATRADLPPAGAECVLFTQLLVRDGGADLFGFATETEREVFVALTGVTGVGPRSAMSVLSALGVAGVLAAAARADATAFSRVPGIGKKLAQRIAGEVPDRLKRLVVASENAAPTQAPEAEAAEALVALGYARSEAELFASQAAREMGAGAASEAIVRAVLRRLAEAAR